MEDDVSPLIKPNAGLVWDTVEEPIDLWRCAGTYGPGRSARFGGLHDAFGCPNVMQQTGLGRRSLKTQRYKPCVNNPPPFHVGH